MIVIVDPGAASTNLGDQIISEAIQRNFQAPLLALGEEVHRIPMHGSPDPGQCALIQSAEHVVVCGTNLLSDHARFRSPWTWTRMSKDLLRGKATFLGVGWWQYQRLGVDRFSATWLRELAGPVPWAVRDNYSQRKLEHAKVASIHLSCPTLWGATAQILPADESRCVFTLTDYNQDAAADRRLLDFLKARYDEVFYWPQGPGDLTYARSVIKADIQVLDASLEGLDDALSVPDTAYVGLRLHAGIRAIQKQVPTLVLAIDNRAQEIASSVNLAVASRFSPSDISSKLTGERVDLKIPTSDIARWLSLWGISEGEQ